MAAPSLWRRILRNSITIGAAGLVAAGAAAHPSAQFASGVNAVEVYVSVTGRDGGPITGLTRNDFQVLEDGEPQTITAFAAGDFPLSVAVGLDRSFSMAGPRLAVAKSAARIFLGALRSEDEASILAIGSEVEVVAPLSTDRQAQYAALAKIDAFGTTGLHDAVIRAIDVTAQGSGRRALVLLSDGDDRYSKATADEALDAARRSEVMIYPVALGRTRPPLFANLATLTGGRSFHVRNTKELAPTLETIALELRHQYLLGYTPTRTPVPGSREWRAIAVKVNRPGARVRARDGYFVK